MTMAASEASSKGWLDTLDQRKCNEIDAWYRPNC